MNKTTPLDGVKVLTSVNKLGGTIIVSIDNIYSLNDNLQDHAFDKALRTSLELKGMLNPILVCTDKDFKSTSIRQFERRPVDEDINQEYRCLIGNNRYKYAIENGYTHIECYVVKSLDEVKELNRSTFIQPRKM